MLWGCCWQNRARTHAQQRVPQPGPFSSFSPTQEEKTARPTSLCPSVQGPEQAGGECRILKGAQPKDPLCLGVTGLVLIPEAEKQEQNCLNPDKTAVALFSILSQPLLRPEGKNLVLHVKKYFSRIQVLTYDVEVRDNGAPPPSPGPSGLLLQWPPHSTGRFRGRSARPRCG